jgi:hypothetical protein
MRNFARGSSNCINNLEQDKAGAAVKQLPRLYMHHGLRTDRDAVAIVTSL